MNRPVGSKNTFLKDFLKNIAILIGIIIILYMIAPEMMRQVSQIFGGLFGVTLIIVILVVAAIPRKRRR